MSEVRALCAATGIAGSAGVTEVDTDFDLIAEITGQSMEWVAPGVAV